MFDSKKEKGVFLNDSLPFNYRLTADILTEYSDNLFNRLEVSGRKQNDKRIALNNMLCNLFTGYYNGKTIAYSRSKNTYSISDMYGMHHYSYANIIPLVKKLKEQKYIEQEKGFFDSEKSTGRNSRIWMNDKMVEDVESFFTDNFHWSFNEAELLRQLKYDSPVILKRNKIPAQYRPHIDTEKMKKFLYEYNEFMIEQNVSIPNIELSTRKILAENSAAKSILSKVFTLDGAYLSLYTPYIQHIYTNNLIQQHTHNITPTPTPLLIPYDNKPFIYNKLDSSLYRVFNEMFSLGGRFYGAEYQGFPEKIRSQILINSKPIVELDYSSLHIKMLYHLIGKDYPDDPYLALGNNDELRKLYKLISLIVINSNSKRDAIRGFNTELYRDAKKHSDRRKNYKLLMKKHDLTFDSLYSNFIDVHKEIEKFFFSGKGLKLQNLDSEIAEDVMKHFISKGIPILCIHDSFIVPAEHEYELKMIMKEIYKKKLNHNIDVKK